MSSVDQRGFFGTLRHLCSDIESNKVKLKCRIESPAKEDFSCTAVTQLQNMKKDVKTLKKESGELLNGLQTQSAEFDSLIKSCQQLVTAQVVAADTMETFMKQYGYTTWGEKQAREAERQAKKEKLTAVEESQSVPEDSAEGHIVQTPDSKPSRINKGTPKLEDFGLSDYTLHALTFGQNRRVKLETNLDGGQSEKETLSRHYLASKVQDQKGSICSGQNVKSDLVATPLSKAERPICGTPKLEDFGLSEDTMHSLNLMRYKDEITSATPQAHKQEYGSYKYGTPQQAVPAIFCNNGIIVTPSLMNGHPIPSETPLCHVGGVKGFETSKGAFRQAVEGNRGQREAVEKDKSRSAVSLRLEDYLDCPENVPPTQPPPARKGLEANRVNNILSHPHLSRRYGAENHMDTQTPVQPELTSRLQMLSKAAEQGSLNRSTPPEPELLSSRLNSLPASSHSHFDIKPASSTPPEPELLSQRLKKQQAAVDKSRHAEMIRKSQIEDKDTKGLPKPLEERVYCVSEVPEPPRFLGKYNFCGSSLGSENVPP